MCDLIFSGVFRAASPPQGADYPHSESTFPRSRKILAEILAGVPEEEQPKIAGGNTARVCNFGVARLTVRRLCSGQASLLTVSPP